MQSTRRRQWSRRSCSTCSTDLAPRKNGFPSTWALKRRAGVSPARLEWRTSRGSPFAREANRGFVPSLAREPFLAAASLMSPPPIPRRVNTLQQQSCRRQQRVFAAAKPDFSRISPCLCRCTVQIANSPQSRCGRTFLCIAFNPHTISRPRGQGQRTVLVP
jgi:hypothetical protein